MSYYKRDQLSIKTNKILANLMAELILLSQKVQSFRQILASVPYYDCVQLFRILDKAEKGYLTLDDFVQLIGENHKKIVTYAFAWFDQGKLGQVSRLQFISFLMPRRNSQLRQTTARRIEQPVNDDNFSTTINEQLRIFTELLNQMISHELKIIEQRRSLLKQQDYSIKGVLHSLDLNAHQFISVIDIVKFLKNYAIEATKEQVNDLLEIVDSKLTGKITLNQLTWIVQGLENNNKSYLSKIKTSIKKKDSKRKHSKNQQSKYFVRTPLKSTQQKSIHNSRSYNTNQVNSQQPSWLKHSNYNPRPAHQIPQTQKNKTQQKNQQNHQNTKERPSSYSNTNFDTILQRYKQAQNQALKKEADLIKTELQMKNKLQDEFQLKSNSRRKVLTESNTMLSQSRRNQKPIIYEQRDFLNNNFRYSRALRNDINNEYRSSSVIKRDRLYDPITLDSIYPYVSKYDKKINTIVENFYKRNTDSSSDAIRKYGTISNSFDQERLRSISTSNNRSLYDRQQSSYNKFLEDDLYGDRSKVKAFDHGSGLLKEEINKKLGDDIFNIRLSDRRYDPLAHQAKQRPLEESIKRLKESSQRIESRVQKLNQKSPKMMENISIISKDIPKIQVSGVKPTYPERQSNIYNTDVKGNRTSTLQSGYQTVARGQTTKNRDLHTTETRFPTRQTESKIAHSPLTYQRRQL